MSNKAALGVILGIVVVIAGVIYMMGSSAPAENEVNIEAPESQAEARGRAVFSVTDAAADMGAISEITLKISGVDVHSAEDGWVTVSTAPRTYDLLSLKARGESELLADTELEVGAYDQVRLAVDSVSVKTKAGATEEARLPSGELKLNIKLAVNEGATSSVNFDFLADKSLHMTGNGDYIFAPVVKTEARSNSTVNVDSESVVLIDGGNVDDSNTAGMDLDGSVKLDFELKNDVKLDIGTDNKIKLGL